MGGGASMAVDCLGACVHGAFVQGCCVVSDPAKAELQKVAELTSACTYPTINLQPQANLSFSSYKTHRAAE
jgi:hypothetical protein